MTVLSLVVAAALGAMAVARAEPIDSFDSSLLSASQKNPENAAVNQAYREAAATAHHGDHYAAAAMFFNIYTAPSQIRFSALARVTEELLAAGMPNAATYFFIKTLESGSRVAIKRVLPQLPAMLDAVGGDLLRPYVLRNTSEPDYDSTTRNHFYYFLGKDELLKGEPTQALQALSKVNSGESILAQVAYLRGAAYAMLGQGAAAIEAFKNCQKLARSAPGASRSSISLGSSGSMANEYLDIEARCTAGLARSYYQMGRHDEAEETYDNIPKSSFVWTDILFEQSWNAYAKHDYNRALGKLVTYRSPDLGFVFNPEVDVLRAQSYFALCHYEDVETVVKEFEARYNAVGVQMKNFLLSHDQDLGAFFAVGKETFQRKLHTSDMFGRSINRFIRGPYFSALLTQEKSTAAELALAQQFATARGHAKFSSFLQKVISWRGRTIKLLGGLFVKNSMNDLYNDLLGQVDKMSFIKLETLNRTKLKLEKKPVMSLDENGQFKRGAADIDRRDYQYFWTFNGEFWADELGDYVFALESQCGT